MKRREFIKLLATATAAPIVILKAKPAAPFIELKAGEVHKSKVYHFESTPMVGDFTLESFRAAIGKAKDKARYDAHNSI